MMKYQNINLTDKTEVEQLLISPSEEIRSNAIVGMVNGIADVTWVQDKLLELVHDENFWVAKNAITGLGDLARIHGTLDLLKVKSALEKINRKDLKGVIESTLADFEIFL